MHLQVSDPVYLLIFRPGVNTQSTQDSVLHEGLRLCEQATILFKYVKGHAEVSQLFLTQLEHFAVKVFLVYLVLVDASGKRQHVAKEVLRLGCLRELGLVASWVSLQTGSPCNHHHGSELTEQVVEDAVRQLELRAPVLTLILNL